MRQRPGLHVERGGPQHRARGLGWPFPQAHHVAVQRRMAQPAEYLLVLRRVAGIHRVRDPVQGHPREHAWQAEAVIPVEMRDADAGDPARRDPGKQHLPLCPLARVEQQPLAIPQQHVAVVVAATGGRLARRPKDHQFPVRHSNRPYARRQLVPERDTGIRFSVPGPGGY